VPCRLFSQQLGTAEEAKAMLDRAVTALKSDEISALSEFNRLNDKQFHDRDLYVLCYKLSDGGITAYSSPALIGVDIRTLTLRDDPIGRRVYDAAEHSPPGTFVTVE
jgi:hypothetical protein